MRVPATARPHDTKKTNTTDIQLVLKRPAALAHSTVVQRRSICRICARFRALQSGRSGGALGSRLSSAERRFLAVCALERWERLFRS